MYNFSLDYMWVYNKLPNLLKNTLAKENKQKKRGYIQMGVPLVQQVLEVFGHVPCYSLQFIWVHLTGLQPLQVQHILLTVGQLVNMGGECQGTRDNRGSENTVLCF